MREGTIKCSCGKSFWISTAGNQTKCVACNNRIDVQHLPHVVKVEEVAETPDSMTEILGLQSALNAAIAKLTKEGD